MLNLYKNVLLGAVYLLLIFSFNTNIVLADGGIQWTKQTNSTSRDWHSIASSSDGTKLVAVVKGGYIYTSVDGGVNWVQKTNDATRPWRSVASSSDGTKLVAVGSEWSPSMKIYTSVDSGTTWSSLNNSPSLNTWRYVTSSSTGVKLAAVANGGYIYTSSDSGATWTVQTSAGSRLWTSITSSSDGTKLAAVVQDGYIYTSSDSGVTWTEQTSAGSDQWSSITSSSDGIKLAAVQLDGYIYTSTDSGVTWTEQTSAGSRDWQSITSSQDGTKLAATVWGGYIYTSADTGVTWTEQKSLNSQFWRSITSSSDGNKLAAVFYSGDINTSVSPDTYNPFMISISSDSLNGTYSRGQIIDIDITFSETVTSAGDIVITLETGEIDHTCSVAVVSSPTVTCNYTIQAGDETLDLNVISVSGVIKDDVLNEMVNFVPVSNLADNKTISIDTVLPIITNITSDKADGLYTTGEVIDIDFTFSENINTGWSPKNSAGSRNWDSITSSADGTKLAAIVWGGYIYTSIDSGITWTEQTSAGSRSWNSIAMSSDGTKLAATVSGGYIYISSDSGATWIPQINLGSKQWSSVVSSTDGTKLNAVVSNNGYIYSSINSGDSWSERYELGLRHWKSIASSSDGTKLAAVIYDGYIYLSNNGGATWFASINAGTSYWTSIASSADGNKLVAVADNNRYIYTSEDAGATWTEQTSAGQRNWSSVASSADGIELSATVRDGGYVYTSNDSGLTWVAQTGVGSRNWSSVTSSSDGTKLFVVNNGGLVYTINPTHINVTFDTGRVCNFSVVSSTTGTCNYIVQTGDNSLDLNVSSMSGDIYDSSLNLTTNFIPEVNLAENKNIVIDTEGATISAISVSGITASEATITWTTDEPASSMAEYGKTVSYGNSVAETDITPMVTSHSVLISNLSICTLYHYKVKSNDSLSFLSVSDDKTFKTAGCSSNSSGGSASKPTPPIVVPSTTIPTNAPIVDNNQACLPGDLFNKNTGERCPVGGSSSTVVSSTPSANSPEVNQSVIPSTSNSRRITKNLKIKTINEEIKILQEYLNTHGYVVASTGPGSIGNETNYFGPKTEAAVILFQSANGLVPDGIVGQITRSYIK